MGRGAKRMWLDQQDCKVVVVEEKELRGTECSDKFDAGFPWCMMLLDHSLGTQLIADKVKPTAWMSRHTTKHSHRDLYLNFFCIYHEEESLWHRHIPMPSWRGLTGRMVKPEYGLNEYDSIWPLNTSIKTQTNFIQMIKDPKSKVSLLPLWADVGKILSQHIKTWLEPNSIYICRTEHNLQKWYSQITWTSETQYITEKERQIVTRAKQWSLIPVCKNTHLEYAFE